MFTQQDERCLGGPQKFAQLRWNEKAYAQELRSRGAAREQLALQQMRVIAVGRDHRNWGGRFRRARSCCFEPWKQHLLPCAIE